jgi:glycosyltransferase involved in cell wall biosynthesis
MISFIVPAHNEEALLGTTLAALHEAARAVGDPYEIVVANDASNDGTANVATAYGARVVHHDRRQIAATRNHGARAAVGDWFFFVDADTIVNPGVMRAATRALHKGAVGGGCIFRFDGQVPAYAIFMQWLLPPLLRGIGLAGGCFLFCTRKAFLTVGGFDENQYAAEEMVFAQRLKQLGRWVVLREHVITSGRKVRAHSAREIFQVLAHVAIRGPRSFRRREGLEIWYGPRRKEPRTK